MLLFSHKPGNETVNTKDKNIRGIGTHNLACLSHMTIDLASLQSRNGARRVFAGPDSQSITKREAPWCVRRVA